MNKVLKICLSLILAVLLFQGTSSTFADTSKTTQWQTVLATGIDEIPSTSAMLASAKKTPSFELWHHSGGYWHTTIEGQDITIYDNDQFDDPEYLASQINKPVTFRMELPTDVKEVVRRGTPLKVVCEVPDYMNLDKMFYFNKGNLQFRIIDGEELEFKAYPKLNFIPQRNFEYKDFVDQIVVKVKGSMYEDLDN